MNCREGDGYENKDGKIMTDTWPENIKYEEFMEVSI